MSNKILALIAMAAVGSLVAVTNADNVINAFVQQFGATPHAVVETPGEVDNVQIDWSFATFENSNVTDFNFIHDCDLTFDGVLPNNTLVICKVTGHDMNVTDNFHNLTESEVIGTGSVLAQPGVNLVVVGGFSRIQVPIECAAEVEDTNEDGVPDTPVGPLDAGPCDIQWIEDVKVIVIGKETTDVVLPPIIIDG
jgi:hypothetical protein